MDAYVILKKIADNKQKLEKMDNKNSNDELLLSYGTILTIVIGSYAAYLSYSCNTKNNVSEIHKIFFAVLSYIFGLIYLLYYFLFRYDNCNS